MGGEIRILVGLDGIIGPAGATRHEGTPLAEDGFLYVTDGYNNAYKIDVRNGVAGYIVWKWEAEMDAAYAFASGCCQRKNRGLAMINDLVIQSTQDGRMVGKAGQTGRNTVGQFVDGEWESSSRWEMWSLTLGDPALTAAAAEEQEDPSPHSSP